ncbi:pitrilysin family protein [Vibrio sp. SCSIO 43136]|uniref:M16 family metallopeptidase n=1 Tax=Vibrio sp. SCSIO 43136 TaxID=2819101 RepID=UPI002075E870|nr:pitrilysin family protein [Vibrio sp. SCSIO 43136]USD65693.1 insulinase family protein [Vibrio sp. SCSIO 43136]
MKKFLIAGLLSVAVVGCSSVSSISVFSSIPEGITFIEQSNPKSDEVAIAYQKYQLDNGLTLILAPDNSDPLVHVDMTYHVGSAREEIGKSGFAHFFEHMMFQGSEHVGDQEHFRIITEAGGTLNGTTNRDRTNYFQTVPSNQLEKMLWLESDRMGYLLNAVSQRKFEVQRDTVKNERAQNYDNRPYGLMWERIGEAMYPEGHPYSWQTIGYVEDLDKVDVGDLKAFFLRWYGPNNATLTIGGDIDIEQTLEWVAKYFGEIPRGPEVEKAPKQPALLAQDRFITLEDRVRQPMLVMSWPTSYMGADDQASLDMLAALLGSSTSSPLYKEFVETNKAVSAGAFHDCAELACTMNVYLMGNANSSLAALDDELEASVKRFSEQPIEDQKLNALVGRAYANGVFGLQSVKGKVSTLAENQVYFDQPNRMEQELDALKSVTAKSIGEVYQKYMVDTPKVTLSVVPKGHPERAARQPNFMPPPRNYPVAEKVDQDSLDVRRPVESFDRSVMPPSSGAVSSNMPELYRLYLDNGIEVIGTVSDETPTVQLRMSLPAGRRYVEEGKEGLAGLTASMLQEGTSKRTIQELELALDTLGSDISINAGGYTTTISVSSLEENVDATLAILKEVLLEPAFEPAAFERVKQQALQSVIYEHQKPSWLASQATREALYGKTLFGRASDGTKSSIEALTLEDVKAFYQQHYTPQGTQVVAVGDISRRQLKSALSLFDDWQGAPAPLFTPQVVEADQQRAIYLVDKANAPQSIVRLARVGLPFDPTGELYLMQLANYNLAGNFNSRINQNLREDKAYTYGANGYAYGSRESGAVVFDAQVRADATVPALREFINEMNEFAQSGVTEKEIQFMQSAIGQSDALKYETPSKKTQLMNGILTYALDEDYLQQRDEILQNIDQSTLNQVAAKWFDPSDYQIIVVGDAKKLKPELETLNIPIKELEIEP